ncbi:MAG: acyl-[ACP]--phospholipid O-acyltransferase [Campylobacterales bacterium]
MGALFRRPGFAVFVLILFLNATVDLAHKITIQNILLKSFEGDLLVSLSAVVNALILLPFILLFSPAGFLSDRFSKTSVIRYSAAAAVALALLITLCYYQGWFYAAFGMTLLLAAQSAIYSPAKYALIKKLAGVQHLGAANGVTQAVTIVAILLSSLFFSVLFEAGYAGGHTPETVMPGVAFIGWIFAGISLFEALLTLRLPDFGPENPEERFALRDYATLRYLRSNMGHLLGRRGIWLSIVGLSTFWGVSQVVIASFPAHFKAMTGSTDAVTIQGILAVSAVGLVAGSVAAGRLSRRHIELGIVPLGALGLFGTLFQFAFASSPAFMTLLSLLFGFFGGLFIVPLNALIQFLASDTLMGKTLAGNNFIQNIVMLAFLMLTLLLVQLGAGTTELFLLAAAVSLLGSLYAVSRLPQLFARILLIPVLRTGYRLHVEGLEQLPQEGGVLLLGNHISWIDWLVLQVASPRPIRFVMHRSIYDRWYLTWLMKFFNVIPIAGGASKQAIETIRARLDEGEVVALFPEGHISYNGQLGTFKKGFELALQGSGHPIVPFYLRGLWGSSFSRAESYYKTLSHTDSKRDLIVAFGTPLGTDTTAEQVKQAVSALSFTAWEDFIARNRPLHHHWLERVKAAPFTLAVADATGVKLSRAKLLAAVLLFAGALRKRLEAQERIGVLLPASAAGTIINMALFVLGKQPVNLNYTLNEATMQNALEKAEIHTVLTSEKFLDKLEGKGFTFDHVLEDRTLALEALAKGFTRWQKLSSALQAYLSPAWLIRALHFAPVSLDDTATVLFSSGSEGTPKGIELTHQNLLSNIKQVSELLNFKREDVILNSLPIFHSFGLTVTTLLPLCEGVMMASVPDPTDAPAVGKMAARYRATILFGTSTFFRLYNRNRKLHPLMFGSIRMVVAGAEKLKPEVKQEFKAKFGLEIYEGYGATETAPVVSVNMPDALDPQTLTPLVSNKPGTVGQPLPGTVVRIVDPDTLRELPIGEDGLILIGGVQVMKGYYGDPEKTAEVIAEVDGVRYYRSGDKGHIDGDGFVTIVDRYSRFAKIGGEMISLGSVEEQLSAVLGEAIECVAVALNDTKKGEKIVLLYSGETEPEPLSKQIRASGIAPLLIPSSVHRVETLPRLASGKTDFKGAKAMAQQLDEA